MKEYLNIGVSVSICIFCYDEDQKKVLVVDKENDPFKGGKVLPHQMLQPKQSLEEVCSEVLEKNIGNNDVYVEQLNAFGKVYRHPSGRIIDISFYGLVNLEKDKIKLNKENNARFEKIDKSLDLVFDHDDIIDIASKRIKRRMKYRPLGKNLLPSQFTMNELEGLYSCFLGKQFDKRNFRRRILEMDFLKEITKVQRNTRGRKAILYEFDPKKYKNYSKAGF